MMVPADVTIRNIDTEKYQRMMQMVTDQLAVATRRFGPMASPHEGYAVILEELDELWQEVRDNKRIPTIYNAAMTEEAAHVCAMAFRFLLDVCHE